MRSGSRNQTSRLAGVRNPSQVSSHGQISHRPRRERDQEGSTLLLALLILGALSILATSVVVTAMGDRNLARYDRHSLVALGAAETGVAFAKRAIIDQTAPMGDDDGDGRPDFELTDSLDWGGRYHVLAEASEVKGLGITAYQANGFSIVSEGSFQGARRRVRVDIVHDSFLKFARFVSQNDLSYGCGAAISGEVYTGRNLIVPCGCGAGQQCQFLESVYTVGDIPNPGCADFFRGYVTHADTIDLSNSFSWTDMRNKAKGLGADNSCEGRGSVGIYMKLTATVIDPLHLNTQAAPNTGVLLLHQFDFMNTTLAAPDTVVTYGGQPVPNTVTGQTLRFREFNGIVFVEGQAKVKGTMDGVSARTMTVFATTTSIVMGDIITGHVGFNPVTRLPNGSGDPVNLGLVAESYVGMDAVVPRVLRVDAVLLSRTSNWRGLGTIAQHPVAGPGPLDLDLDGINGEAPHNNDPIPGQGWNEQVIDANTWVLNLNGPILTTSTGDAQPWNSSTVLANATGPTRRYNYDMDVTEYPPPCFPVPLNLWKDVAWCEIQEVATPLASHLPD